MPAGQAHFSAQPAIQITRGSFLPRQPRQVGQPASRPGQAQMGFYSLWLAQWPIPPCPTIQITGQGYGGVIPTSSDVVVLVISISLLRSTWTLSCEVILTGGRIITNNSDCLVNTITGYITGRVSVGHIRLGEGQPSLGERVGGAGAARGGPTAGPLRSGNPPRRSIPKPLSFAS